MKTHRKEFADDILERVTEKYREEIERESRTSRLMRVSFEMEYVIYRWASGRVKIIRWTRNRVKAYRFMLHRLQDLTSEE